MLTISDNKIHFIHIYTLITRKNKDFHHKIELLSALEIIRQLRI